MSRRIQGPRKRARSNTTARTDGLGSTPTMTKVTTISLNGHPTWAKLPRGKGTTLVLLHGGMSSSASLLKSVGPSLAKRYRVAAFDRRGHGRTADTDEPFSYDAMADETIAFIEHLG